MRKLHALALVLGLCAAGAARAGIIFEPHLSEYDRLPEGEYTEGLVDYTAIRNVYDREGHTIASGTPFIPPGERIDGDLMLAKFLWVGNVFRDTHVPLLNTHPQYCRAIVELGYEQATGAAVAMDNAAGQRSNASGIGDFYGLCGLYGNKHVWGPVRFNGTIANTVKFPIGQYNSNSLLNIGTHYWSIIPQYAWHADVYGRAIMDASLAYQINERNEHPAFGGLTPTRPADWFNAEVNLAWKFDPHWYTDVGYHLPRLPGHQPLRPRNSASPRRTSRCRPPACARTPPWVHCPSPSPSPQPVQRRQ